MTTTSAPARSSSATKPAAEGRRHAEGREEVGRHHRAGTCCDGPRPVTVKFAVWYAAIESSVCVARCQSRKSGHDADGALLGGAAQIQFVDCTSRSGSANGSGRSTTARTTLNIAALAPMPRLSVRTAAMVNAGAFGQRAPRVAQVLPEMLDRRPAPHVAHRFLDQQHVAELPPRRRGRLLGRFAAVDAILDRHPQMALQLLVELAHPAAGASAAVS